MLKCTLSPLVQRCRKALSLNELLTAVGESTLLQVFKNVFSAQRGGMGCVFCVNEIVTNHQKLSLHSCVSSS